MNLSAKSIALWICLMSFLTGCNSLDMDRIPAVAVNINLDDPGVWNTYGVAGFGQYRMFIRDTREPRGFPYLETTYTGYGGILLISGMDPYTSEPNVPLAYDLACPVECQPGVRVFIDDSNLDAVCPVCGSHYDVVMAGGAPVAGPAMTGNVKYALQSYRCLPARFGGYIITR